MTDSVQAVAAALLQARRDRRPVDAAPLAQSVPSAQDAYAVQDAVARAFGWFADGAARHWKSGGPSRDKELTHAPLPPGGVRSSPADLRDLHFNVRMIEAEVALRLKRQVSAADAAGLDPATGHELVDAMCVSIEIVDSRWQDMKQAPALVKLADLQSHGALVLGAWQPFARRDWAAQACTVTIGGNEPKTFRGTHSLGDPAWLLPLWLKHATRHGDTVPAGAVVTTGTWCGLLEAQAGDRVRAVFDGIGEAELQL
jgi:2-keto-4-pentenoate hydratase